MLRIPRWGLLLLGLSLAFGLMTAAMTIRVPDQSVLAPLPGGGRLDYAAGPGGPVELLEDEFIRGVLGRLVATPGGTMSRLGTVPEGSRAHRSRAPRDEDLPEPPDALADARTITTVPYSGRTDARQASRQRGVDPEDCSRLGGTLWFRYRSTADEELIADTIGSSYATSLGVFVEHGDKLTLVDCDSESSGWAVADFEASAGTTYFFQISSQAQGGRLVFNLNRRGTVAQESLDAAGAPGNDSSYHAALSAQGRHIAFFSLATNLDGGTHQASCTRADPQLMVEEVVLGTLSTRACSQLYVRDRVTGRITLASVSTSGGPGNGSSWWWSDISADGRYVAFQSLATDLVPGDTNGVADIFVRDLVAGRTERVSLSDRDEQALGLPWEADRIASWMPSISDDGRYVAFQSGARLVANDTNGEVDVFIRDRLAGTTTRVSVASSGRQKSGDDTAGPQPFLNPCLSPDGRLVRFASRSPDLVNGDTNERLDVFVHDHVARSTERISLSESGDQGDDDSGATSGRGSCFSGDNRYVVFDSNASNLVGNDGFSRPPLSPAPKVFVHDRQTRAMQHVEAGASTELFHHVNDVLATAGSGWRFQGSGGETGVISRNGRYVVFEWSPCSPANPIISCRGPVVWRHDLLTGFLELLPVPEGDDASQWSALAPDVSADGSVVSFDWRWQVDRPAVFPPGTERRVYTWERPGETR